MRPGASYTRISPVRHLLPTHSPEEQVVAQDTLTITDNRTGRTYEVPVADGHHPGDGPPPDQGRRTTTSG